MRTAAEEAKELLVERLAKFVDRVPVPVHSRTNHEWPDLDLTMRQVRTLSLLSEGPRRITDISASLDRGMGSVSSMIDRLVKKGLVRRVEDPTDRRVVTCEITAHGTDLVNRFWRIRSLKIESIATLLSVNELSKVADAMEILSNAVHKCILSET